MPKYLWMNWASFGRLSSSLATKIEKSGKKFDLVVAIARGGIPLGMVISDRINCKIDIINVKSYVGIRKRVKPQILTTINSSVKGKRILLVDDLIEEGHTMFFLRDYFLNMKPKSFTTATLFIKPWSKFIPEFYTKKVDRWVIFPWEPSEFGRMKKK